MSEMERLRAEIRQLRFERDLIAHDRANLIAEVNVLRSEGKALVARVRDVVDRLADDDLRYDTSHGAAGQMRLLDDLRAALDAEEQR